MLIRKTATSACKRVKLAGKSITCPGLKIVHYGGEGGTRIHPYRSVYEWHRSYFLYDPEEFCQRLLFPGEWIGLQPDIRQVPDRRNQNFFQ